MNRAALLVFAVAALMSSPTRAQEAPVAALPAAWNAADPKSWSHAFWPDCEFTNILGQVFHGAAENGAQHARIWADPYLGSHFEAKVVRIWPLGPDHALVDTEATVTGYKALPPGIVPIEPGRLVTRFRHIVERRHGEWRILFSQNTVVTPLPPPAR